MRKIFAVARKEILLRFASPSEWIFFLVLPIVFTLILAGGTGEPADARVRLLVADQANSPLSSQLIEELQQSEAVRADLLALDEAEDAFSQRDASVLLIIPAEYKLEQVRQGGVEMELRQLPNNMDALMAAREVQSILARVNSGVSAAVNSLAEAERIRPFASEDMRQAYFEEALAQAQSQLSSAPERVSVKQGATEDQVDYDPRANSSAGQLITWVFIPLLGIGVTFAYERRGGTLRRLLTTPSNKAVFLLGTIGGNVVAALVQMLLLVGFGALALNLNWGQSPAALAVMMVSSALAAAALGTTLGTFIKTEGQANGMAIMLGMVMALLGGCWYPLELFPEFVRTVVKVLPTTWSMQGLLDIVLRGEGLVGVLPEAGVLLGFALLFLVIGVRRFRYE